MWALERKNTVAVNRYPETLSEAIIEIAKIMFSASVCMALIHTCILLIIMSL